MTIDKNQLGRNEPCSCGSGKKFKRCCGKDAAPKLGVPMDMSKKLAKAGFSEQASALSGFDPSQMDPQWLAEVQKMMQKMPRGQLQKMQSVMQKAMAGKDVSREAAELDQMMPPELIEMMKSGPMASLMTQTEAQAAAKDQEMSVEQARQLVEEAAMRGEISSEEAQGLLAETKEVQAPGKFGQFWRKLSGK